MSKDSIIKKLKEISLFADVPENDLFEIASITTERFYKPGDIIIEENSHADTFYIIHSGKVEILKDFEDGLEVVLGVYSLGEFFGEMSILDEGPRSATARAMEATTLLQVSYNDFERVLAFAPQIAYAIMKELSSRLRHTSALLVWQLNRKNRELEEAAIETVKSITRLLEKKGSYFEGHSERVSRMAIEIGEELNLSEQEIKYLELGGLLHDIGMLYINENSRLKKGPFNDEEQALLKKHTLKNKDIIKHLLLPIEPYIMYHHERFDGSGYPEKLSGQEIPLGSRIIAVAEVFDAMTSDRPHRKKSTINEAINDIKKLSGKDFDPEVVNAFMRVMKKKLSG